MKKWLLGCLAGVLALSLQAQEPYPQLGAKLDSYLAALVGESASAQSAECDFLINTTQDSLLRQYVALKLYDHYLQSPVMGDDAVAVHVAREWLLSGKVAMHSEEDLFNARLFVEFNQHSLIGMAAPAVTLFSPSGEGVQLPPAGEWSVLYFYDTSCSTCKRETARLKDFVQESDVPVFAIYVGGSDTAWEAYRTDFPGVTHLWDPTFSSDWQRLYGVLQTPRMFLVNPSGVIVGRGLDTPALRQLLAQELASASYTYGEPAMMERYRQFFVPYGEALTVDDVMEVADYLAARTEGSAFKQVMGDFLYYLYGQKTEVYRSAVTPFVQKYILRPDIWTSAEDKAQVVSLGEMLLELVSRTPVGSQVPDLKVAGVLRRKPCFLVPGSRSGVFSLRKLKGNPGYLVFYTGNCSSCRETLAAVDALVAREPKARVLLVDMDALMADNPSMGEALLDSFDLSALPMIIQLDKNAVVQHKYLSL